MGAGSARNGPCPCGSGRKYKRCCLGRAGAEEERAELLEEGRRDAAKRQVDEAVVRLRAGGRAAVERTITRFEDLLVAGRFLGHVRFDPEVFEALVANAFPRHPHIESLMEEVLEELAGADECDRLAGELEDAACDPAFALDDRLAARVAARVAKHRAEPIASPSQNPFLVSLFLVQASELLAETSRRLSRLERLSDIAGPELAAELNLARLASSSPLLGAIRRRAAGE